MLGMDWQNKSRWTGKINPDGYGVYRSNFSGKKKTYLAHKLSYLIIKGDIPPDKMVRHSCDNTICVCPDHLILGTAKDNAEDCVKRGRNIVRTSADKQVTCSMLTVHKMRRIYRNFIKSVGKRYNMNYFTTKYIIEASNREITGMFKPID